MTLPTLVALAEAVANLQKRVDKLEKEPHRNVIVGGGTVSDHGSLTGREDDNKGHSIYVPVDGVARQLADAGYPNALLLDGSRAMLQDLTQTSQKKFKWSATEFIDNYNIISGLWNGIRIKSSDTIGIDGNIISLGFANFASFFTMQGTTEANKRFNSWSGMVFRTCNNGVYEEVARIYGNVSAPITTKLEISRAGDIDHGAVSSAFGPILKDRTMGTKYRLYVDNGVLGIEAV